MAKVACRTVRRAGLGVVVFLVLFIVVFFLFRLVGGLVFFVFIVVVIVIIVIFRDNVEMHGMRLRDFELGLAFGAAEDFALFHFVLVDVDFSGTFGAADHVGILRRDNGKVGAAGIASTTVEQLLYTAA
jgi:hypothetical protein